jgi:hypothetical protein
MVVLIGIGLGWVFGMVFAVMANRYVPYLADERPGILARLSPKVDIRQTARMALGVIFMYWGIVGAALGGLHNLISVVLPVSGLGSPNLVYSVVATALGLALAYWAANKFPLFRRDAWVLSAVFIVLFAWVLPVLGA